MSSVNRADSDSTGDIAVAAAATGADASAQCLSVWDRIGPGPLSSVWQLLKDRDVIAGMLTCTSAYKSFSSYPIQRTFTLNQLAAIPSLTQIKEDDEDDFLAKNGEAILPMVSTLIAQVAASTGTARPDQIQSSFFSQESALLPLPLHTTAISVAALSSLPLLVASCSLCRTSGWKGWLNELMDDFLFSGNSYPFSCYGHDGMMPTVIKGDISFEEIAWKWTQAREQDQQEQLQQQDAIDEHSQQEQRGNRYSAEVTQLEQEKRQKRRMEQEIQPIAEEQSQEEGSRQEEGHEQGQGNGQGRHVRLLIQDLKERALLMLQRRARLLCHPILVHGPRVLDEVINYIHATTIATPRASEAAESSAALVEGAQKREGNQDGQAGASIRRSCCFPLPPRVVYLRLDGSIEGVWASLFKSLVHVTHLVMPDFEDPLDSSRPASSLLLSRTQPIPWPPSLLFLTPPRQYSGILTAKMFPQSLRSLFLSRCKTRLNNQSLPTSLTSLALSYYKHPLEPGTLPPLQHLRLLMYSHDFLLKGVIPSSLVELELISEFVPLFDADCLPVNLVKLMVAGSPQQYVVGLQLLDEHSLPRSITHLSCFPLISKRQYKKKCAEITGLRIGSRSRGNLRAKNFAPHPFHPHQLLMGRSTKCVRFLTAYADV